MNEETPRWLDPRLRLGLRCVLLAQRELARGARAQPYGQPNTSHDVREYFSGCVRDVNGETRRLWMTEGNWCAAFASWCLDLCFLPGDVRPHKWRASVVEMVADAKELGLYHNAEDVWKGNWTPQVGDLVIWDRSEKDKPESAWWRHVNRLTAFDEKRGLLSTIGGNEERAIKLVSHPPKNLHRKKLLGFISYAGNEVDKREREREQQKREEDLMLVAAFVEAHRKGLRA